MSGSVDSRPEWEQINGEPDRWFARFERFRLLGPTRSILAAFRAEATEKNAKNPNVYSPKSWYTQAKKWDWRERAAAWDASEIAKVEDEWRKRAEMLRNREWEAALRAFEKAGQLFQFPVARTETETEDEPTEDGVRRVTHVTVIPRQGMFGEAARVLSEASKVGRLATGLANNREEVSGPNGGPLQVNVSAEFRRALEAVYGDDADNEQGNDPTT